MLRHLILRNALPLVECCVSRVDFGFGGRKLAVIFPHPFIADFKGMTFHQHAFFSYRLHGF